MHRNLGHKDYSVANTRELTRIHLIHEGSRALPKKYSPTQSDEKHFMFHDFLNTKSNSSSGDSDCSACKNDATYSKSCCNK